MSMNLHVTGYRNIIVEKTGARDIQYISFDLNQTPTKVTRAILNSEDHIQAYKDWVNSNRYEYEEPVYAEDDIWEEGEPIGVKMVCDADDHLKDFDNFIKDCEDDGYELKFYEL